MDNQPLIIDTSLVHRLITTQFPKWKDLLIRPVAESGWDNRIFHLGESMLVRLPSAAIYAFQVEKEQKWLPRLAPFLPLQIPLPLACGEPMEGYLWKWSVYRWLEGDAVASTPIANLNEFATTLAKFLKALQRIDSREGPVAGQHSFYRGGVLTTYDAETRQAIVLLEKKIDAKRAREVWASALATSWQSSPVWVHGDISSGNLLLKKGKLSAVIDFGQLAVGDPACDLAIAWTLFNLSFGFFSLIFREFCSHLLCFSASQRAFGHLLRLKIPKSAEQSPLNSRKKNPKLTPCATLLYR